MITRNFGLRQNEKGNTIVLVLGVSVLLMSILAAALASSNDAGNGSSKYLDTSQAALAAQSGLAVALSNMRTVTTYTSFPCGAFSGALSAPGATSSYSGTITYFPSGNNPSALTCSGSTLGGSTVPATATVISVGKDARGSPIKMEEQVAIAATSTPAAALGYALFTENSLNLTGAATVTSSAGNTANMYSGGVLTCGTGDNLSGPVTTYGVVNFTGSCNVTGITASGSVTLANGVQVNIPGNVISYGGSIALSGSAKIWGNATETNGNITVPNGTIVGNAAASGSITLSGGGHILGTQTPSDSALSSQTMPAAVSFPALDPSGLTTWQNTPGWNVIQVGTGGAAPTCANYFANVTSGASNDPFQLAINAMTTKTVFYAPSCVLSYTNAQTFNFGADAVLEVQSFTTIGSDTYQSNSGTRHDFSLLASVGAACGPSPDVSVSNSSNFDPSLTVFVYTPGQVSYANAPSMTGQIVACGGFVGSNSFALTFDPSASGEIPGSGSLTAPTVSVTNKFVN